MPKEDDNMADEEADGKDQASSDTSTESQDNGTSDESGDDVGVALSEQFQKEVTPMIQSATKPELEFMRSLIMEREKQLMHSESKATKSSTFDTSGMPE